MTAPPVVEDLNVIKYVGPCLVAGGVDAIADTLLLEAAEEALRHRVVPAVAAPAHAGRELVVATEPHPVIAAVLGALVGVHDHRCLGMPVPDGHEQGIE